MVVIAHLEEYNMIYFEKGGADVVLSDQDLVKGLAEAFEKIRLTR